MSAQTPVEQELHALQQENQALRAEIARHEERARAGRETRAKVIRIGWRVLVPLLDRQKVVRSFGKMVNTVSGFAGPRDGWPGREELLGDARTFLESCVRFVVRRHTFLLLFSLIASTIPILQLWLVIKQNDIIENQNKFFEVDSYQTIVEALSDPDRAQITGALMANVQLEFMRGVVEEVFDPELAALALRQEDVDDADQQYTDAGFRGNLIRAASQGVRRRWRTDASKGDLDEEALHEIARPMFRAVLGDAAWRVPLVIRLGRDKRDRKAEDTATYYLYQVGYLLRVYARLARAAGEEKAFFADIKPLFVELARSRFAGQGQFAEIYRILGEEFLFDLALQPKVGDPPASPEAGGKNLDDVKRTGFERLRSGLGKDALDWQQLANQLGVPS